MSKSLSRPATKADIKSLQKTTKADIESFQKATKADIESLQKTTKADIESLRQATKADIHDLRKEIKEQFATKEDLKQYATKEDLKQFATKEDLKQFATKGDFAAFAEDMTEQFRKFRLEFHGKWIIVEEMRKEIRTALEANAEISKHAAFLETHETRIAELRRSVKVLNAIVARTRS
jgi:hypothetical protein